MREQTHHFIGLGGIGMSALARILLQKGTPVQGSDIKQSSLLEELGKEGVQVHIGHRKETIDTAEVVVYSTDIKSGNVELETAKARGIPLLHRSDLLSLLMREKKPLLVTGTHGKTTTTALLASVLEEAKMEPSFVIGGIHQTWKTNGRFGNGAYFVAEADESDGSFLKTAPFGAIVTNLENDHLDYWKTEEHLDAAFGQFFAASAHPEHLFWCGDDSRLQALQPKGVSYGFQEGNALRIDRFSAQGSTIFFSIEWAGKRYEKIELNLCGAHNALNGAAVFGLCLSLNIAEPLIRRAFRSFAGTQRRLEKKGSAHAVELYDDYGHHPTEIRVTLRGLRAKIREKRLVVVFQPHRFTRARDLFDEFARSFEEADLVWITDIFSAGEAPIAGIDALALYAKMKELYGDKVQYAPRSSIEASVAEQLCPHDVVLTLGAGDVTKAGDPILERYRQRAPRFVVGVLFGGTSVEHPVSLMSARNILSQLDSSLYEVKRFGVTKQGHWVHGPDALAQVEQKQEAPLFSGEILEALLSCDVLIPVFHGVQGEDGMMQGLFDTLQIPYAGCEYRSAALCMHKGWTKQAAVFHSIPTAPYVEIDAVQYRQDPVGKRKEIEAALPYPLWIKPVHLGSSFGVTRVNGPEELEKAIDIAFFLDDTLIAERHVEGRQIEFAVLGNEHIRVALPCEILNDGAFYDYHKKYTPGACVTQVPASITPEEMMRGEELARAMYQKIGCRGLSRIDFFLDQKGDYWLNEINPFPGFTNTSAYPLMWQGSGLSLKNICDELVILAFHRSRRLQLVRGR
jgi:UDP-N-acetylmuramate--alanine ligase